MSKDYLMESTGDANVVTSKRNRNLIRASEMRPGDIGVIHDQVVGSDKIGKTLLACYNSNPDATCPGPRFVVLENGGTFGCAPGFWLEPLSSVTIEKKDG